MGEEAGQEVERERGEARQISTLATLLFCQRNAPTQDGRWKHLWRRRRHVHDVRSRGVAVLRRRRMRGEHLFIGHVLREHDAVT
jgi:hypothetical protein